MKRHLSYAKYPVALLLAWSATLLFSCGEAHQTEPANEELLISQSVDSMFSVTTSNGKKTRTFFTPMMEEYAFATVPFQEYRKGIEVISYNDTTGMVSSHIVSDYALYWIDRDLWELKGNVVAKGENGRTLYTQQLTWDVKIKKIYSNVDSKIEEGSDVFIGEGFEATEDFSRWTFRRLKGRVSVDTEPVKPGEQAAADSLSAPRTTLPTAPPEPQPASTEVPVVHKQPDGDLFEAKPLELKPRAMRP